MPPIRIAHSTVAGHTPILTLPGQLGINETDGLLFYRNASGTTLSMPIGAGTNPGALWGLTLSNAADTVNDITIDAGVASEGASPFSLMTLGGSLTKRLDAAWAVGTNQGGIDAGGVADGTYHVFLIQRPDTSVVDALFSTSPTAPTMPASYTRKRRIGSIVRAGGTILQFSQYSDQFLLKATVEDFASTLSTGATTIALTVPTGIKVYAMGRVSIGHSTTTVSARFSSLDENDEAPVSGGANSSLSVSVAAKSVGVEVCVRTNTSGQVRGRSTASNTNTSWRTYGWSDPRGRDGTT